MSYTPTLEDLFDSLTDNILSTINTCMPAIVVDYDNSTQRAKVQPCFKRKYSTGEVKNLPIIVNVPILFPRTENSFISFPIKKNDYVLLLFSQRSLDKFLSQGGIVAVDDPRKFDLTDAIALVGFFHTSIESSEDAIRIKNKDTKIDIKDNGKFCITNTSNEFVSILVDLIQAIIDMKINTMLGPQMPINLATFIELKTKLETFKC